MALRVLLADESSTIKKVMLLALQDFAVEVKAVHVGVDALEVARSFKPDIIFVDVLLQKKNGYDVCAELKADATTRHTPTVLMWSSFMELDQEQLQRANPNDKIEKPFDVETLRKLVLKLVPETRSQRLAHFLEFPESANEAMKQEAQKSAPPPPVAEKAPTKTSIPLPPPAPNSRTAIPVAAPVAAPEPPNIPVPPPVTKTGTTKPSWSMDSFEDINEFAAGDLGSGSGSDSDSDEEFAPMNLSRATPPPKQDERELTIEPLPPENTDEPWAHQDLSRFKIDLPPVSVDNEGIDLKIDMGEEEFTASGFLYKPSAEPQPEPRVAAPPPPPQPAREELQLEEIPDDDLTQPVLELPDMPAGSLSLEPEDLAEPLAPMRDLSRETSFVRRDALARENLNDEIPRLTPERIEEIIRAQSREVIEEIVRRIVPDIATAMIREELDRLLEEGSDRQTRRRETRP